jgi:UDP-N-acetylmuramoylalanine--D-glutamate ligase
MQKQAKIGIWGFGVVGQSVVKYLHHQNYTNLLVYDHKPADGLLLGLSFEPNLNLFLEKCDHIFVSPGVDTSNYLQYQAKFCSELDLFYANWKKPIIAITGTLGKTTLTTVLTNLLNQAGLKAVAAGNIGLAVCDILDLDYELAVLELSSFQLDQMQDLAPDFAIWTNFFPNHLDRHQNLKNYFLAKAKIFGKQNASQITLLPISLVPNLIEYQISFVSQLYFFGEHSQLNKTNLDYVQKFAKGVFVLEREQLFLHDNFGKVMINDLNCLAGINTYQINLAILLIVFYLKKLVIPKIVTFEPIAHRVELFWQKNGIDWYNDSKSTVGEATLAAVQKLSGKSLILFLGGVSKGVDRTGLIGALKDQVKLVICFGAEADFLYQTCLDYQISSAKFINLESAVNYVWQIAVPGDCILFSPAGASFDLFANYIERGNAFKALVLK